jgi:hypothetical protein
MPLREVGVPLREVGVPLREVGVLLPQVNVLLPQVNVLLPQVGALLREVGVLLPQVGVLLPQVGVLLWRRTRLSATRLARDRSADRSAPTGTRVALHGDDVPGFSALPAPQATQATHRKMAKGAARRVPSGPAVTAILHTLPD